MIPGQAQQFFEGAAASGGSFQIDRSLRFNSEDSSYLNRTPSSAGDRRTWTYSTWIKRSNLTAGDYVHIFGHYVSDYTLFVFKTGDNRLQFWTNGGAGPVLETSAVLRDPSAWYHIVLAVDTTQSTASDRAHIYINGVEASYDVDDRASQLTLNLETYINSTNVHEIGGNPAFTSTRYFNGYLAENHLVDGTQLAASDFGETDTNGVWQPKDCKNDLTYGTNGFYLKFADNSSVAALGTDSSGNSNTWTAYNFSVAATDYTSTATATLLGSSSWDPSYNTVSKVFDGSGDGLRTVAEVSNQGEKFSVTFSPAITLSNETVSVDTSSTYQGMFVTLNGVDQSRTSDSDSAVSTLTTAALTGSLSKITMDNGTDTSGRPASMLRIRIGGVVLLDTTDADNDSLIDTPSNYTAGSGNNGGNYATLNTLSTDINGSATLTDGNLKLSATTFGHYIDSRSTIAASIFDCYCEMYVAEKGAAGLVGFGIGDITSRISSGTGSYIAIRENGEVRSYPGNTLEGTVSSFTTADVIGLAASSSQVKFYKNGSLEGTFSHSLTGDFFVTAMAYHNGNNSVIDLNFGQRQFQISSVPTGYKSLCTTNLPDPTIADGSTLVNALTWAGDSSPRTLSGLSFTNTVGLAWIKNSGASINHVLQDVVRGFTTGKKLSSNIADAEGTSASLSDSYGYISGASSTGFTIDKSGTGQDWVQMNQSSNSYVGWAWDAGSSTSSNSDGSITSDVRANTSAGFSIVSYTGDGVAGATVGHGLNDQLGLLIVKNRSTTDTISWGVKHSALYSNAGNWVSLSSTSAATAESPGAGSLFNATNPTSSVFTLGPRDTTNTSGDNYIAYCWAPVEGYSAFGSYIGNGSNDGPFVFLNFRPRWVLIKCSSTTGDWFIHDSVRDPYNSVDDALRANLANATSTTGDRMQFLSNGFQITKSNLDMNGSGRTFIYAAFAEHPFKSARAR